MKVKEILELNVTEFKKLLTDETLEYLETRNTTLEEDLESYQDGATFTSTQTSEEDLEKEYMEVNEYFEAVKEQEEE